MTEGKAGKRFDLEERTFLFTRSVIEFTKTLPKTLSNVEIIRQVVKSSGSIGANYIEANEALSKKDFGMRIKICRKEAKETQYWLKLLETKGQETTDIQQALVNEAIELTKIFGSIVEKLK